MGALLYGTADRSIDIDDRALAHLQVVIIAKLRRGESFAFSWEQSSPSGTGRSSLWISPAMYVEFAFYGSRRVPLNRDWVDALLRLANSSSGLELVAEPTP